MGISINGTILIELEKPEIVQLCCAIGYSGRCRTLFLLQYDREGWIRVIFIFKERLYSRISTCWCCFFNRRKTDIQTDHNHFSRSISRTELIQVVFCTTCKCQWKQSNANCPDTLFIIGFYSHIISVYHHIIHPCSYLVPFWLIDRLLRVISAPAFLIKMI